VADESQKLVSGRNRVVGTRAFTRQVLVGLGAFDHHCAGPRGSFRTKVRIRVGALSLENIVLPNSLLFDDLRRRRARREHPLACKVAARKARISSSSATRTRRGLGGLCKIWPRVPPPRPMKISFVVSLGGS
jgi:hypothetical protein